MGYGLPSKQMVSVVGGCRQARNVEVGSKLWSLDARFTPRPKGSASALVVADRWRARGTFVPEQHPPEPTESAWVEVRDVQLRRAEGAKPFTLYSYRLDPHPGFLVNGHLARQPW